MRFRQRHACTIRFVNSLVLRLKSSVGSAVGKLFGHHFVSVLARATTNTVQRFLQTSSFASLLTSAKTFCHRSARNIQGIVYELFLATPFSVPCGSRLEFGCFFVTVRIRCSTWPAFELFFLRLFTCCLVPSRRFFQRQRPWRSLRLVQLMRHQPAEESVAVAGHYRRTSIAEETYDHIPASP